LLTSITTTSERTIKYYNIDFGRYANHTIETSSPTEEIVVDETIDKNIHFYAENARSGGLITDYWLHSNNSTTSQSLQFSDSNTITQIGSITQGSTDFELEKSGFDRHEQTETISCTTDLVYMDVEEAGIEVGVYNEDTDAGINYNITFSDGDSSEYFEDQTTRTFFSYDEIVLGEGISIRIESEGYQFRVYTRDLSNESFVNMSAYLLEIDDGLIRSFHIMDSGGSAIPGAILTAWRYIDGAWTEIESKSADDSGTVTMYLDPDITYRFEAVYSDFTSGILTIQPTQSSYSIIIPYVIDTSQWSNIFQTIWWNYEPKDSFVVEDDAVDFKYMIHDSDGELEWFSFVLVDENSTVLFSNNTTDAPTGGVISAELNTTGLSNITGTFSFKKENFGVWSVEREWDVLGKRPGNYTLFTFFEKLEDDTTIPSSTKAIISLFIVIGIMAGLVVIMGSFGAALVGMGILTLLAMFNWFPVVHIIFIWTALIGYLVLARGGTS